MITLRCCVIDDEPLAAQLISNYVKRTPFLELLGTYTTSDEAIAGALSDPEGLDLVFTDIDMPHMNGLDLARILPTDCMLIFTTAHSKYAVDGFKLRALDYLLKPISYQEFLSAADKALKHKELLQLKSQQSFTVPSNITNTLLVKSERRLIQIPVNNILYIEGLKDYVKIYTDIPNLQSPVVTQMSMKVVESSLPASTFLRVHRSFIVNMQRVLIIERNKLTISDPKDPNQTTTIPVSDAYRQAINMYVSRNQNIKVVSDPGASTEKPTSPME